MKAEKQVIGRREKIDFPELDLYHIDAKVDTGAYTSALHCHDISIHKHTDGKTVQFYLLDPTHSNYNHRKIELPVFDERRIKNSFGQVQKRVIIKTRVSMFGKNFPIELSLTDRSKMEYPILLGRKFIKSRFIVDISKVNVSYKSLLKNE